MKNKKKGVFTLAVILILSAAGTVAASGLKSEVTAVKNLGASIFFDGVNYPLPTDYPIIMYNDRVYTPARYVAEKLGAEVDWDAEKEIVNITTPATPTPQPTAAPAPSATPEPTKMPSANDFMYSPLPLKIVESQISIMLYEFDPSYDIITLDIEIENNSSYILNHSLGKSYITINGGSKIEAIKSRDNEYTKALNPGEQLTQTLDFDESYKSTDKIKLVIPVTITNTSTHREQPYDFVFYITPNHFEED